MFSSLLLADGPVTVQELHGAGVAPHRLVLASCHSGADVAYVGDEVLGFVSAMLAQGTAGVVASIAAVPDVAAVDLMLELHRGLRDGQTLARALHAARGRIDRRQPRGLRQLVHVQRPRRRLTRRIWSVSPRAVLWEHPKTAGRRPCRAHAVLASRSPEVPQQRRPAQVRVPGWFGLRRACLPSPAPARGSFVCRGVTTGGTTIGRIAMARPDKAAAVAELTDLFRDSNAAVLTEYRGLTVAQLKKLRKALSGNATYAVVKNTLTAIAAKDAGLEGLDDALKGPSAIAFVSGDPVEAAKGLRDFAKANPALVIKGGVLDGRALTAADVTKLADLESREVLLAKAAGVFKASLFQAAYLFTAPAAQAARTVDALRLKLRSRPRSLPEPSGARHSLNPPLGHGRTGPPGTDRKEPPSWRSSPPPSSSTRSRSSPSSSSPSS